MVDTLLWKYLKNFTKNKFNVWSNNGQLIFAELVWQAIVNAGIADYSDHHDSVSGIPD